MFPRGTPAAWTTCTSGCDPQTHGLTDFQLYRFEDNVVQLTSTHQVKVPNLWHYLGAHGYRVASLNVPFTFPPYAINGYMVCGLGCAGTSSDFTYPKEFREKILREIPDYGIALGPEGLNKRNNALGGTQEEFEANLRRLQRRFEMRVELARMIQRDDPVDIMMVQFQQLDLLQHLAWPYIAAESRDRFGWYRDRIFTLL